MSRIMPVLFATGVLGGFIFGCFAGYSIGAQQAENDRIGPPLPEKTAVCPEVPKRIKTPAPIKKETYNGHQRTT